MLNKIGFIGLGRMGQAMVLQLLEKGVDVVAYNRTQQKIEQLSAEFKIYNLKFKIIKAGNLYPAETVEKLINQLHPPRIIFLMVEHGKPVDEMLVKLGRAGMTTGDIIIDGGNSYYKDSIRRFNSLNKLGIHFLDIGISGGLDGARHGACMMVGGEREMYEYVRPMLELITVSQGLTYFGPSGAGHFVKMIHNGVEYGMLQAIGEGFEILHRGPYKLDLALVAKNWSNGSVVRGWLIELLHKALGHDKTLAHIEGVIGGGSTGEWTVKAAEEFEVETPVINSSLEARKKSLAKPTFSAKVIAALRREFGGHETIKKSK